MTTKLTEGKRPGEYLLSEVGMISRDQIVVNEGEDLEAGTVLEASGDGYVQLATPASAAAILFGKTDATEGDVKAAAHTRLCEVVDALLVWPDGISDNDKATAVAALAEKLIIVRTADQ